MRTRTSVIFFALAFLTHVPPVSAEDPTGDRKREETALEAAQRYVQMFKDGKAPQAVETFWEIDLNGIFGDALAKHSAAEQEEVRQAFGRWIQKVVANIKAAELMAKATYSDFKSEPLDNGRVAVTFTIAHPEQTVPSLLILRRSDEKWRIVDGGRDTKRLMVPRLKELYQKTSKGMTPLEFVQAYAPPKK